MNFFENINILYGSVIILVFTFIIRIPVLCRPKSFSFQYSANTKYKNQDHNYRFNNIMMKDGFYRCYIEQAPFLFGKRFSRYTIDYGYDKKCGKCYIISTSKVKSVDDAKKLCAEWSNFNQYVIDSHRYKNW